MTQHERAQHVADACRSAVNAYLMTRAYAETMRERVDIICRAVLAEAPLDVSEHFREHGRPEKILDPKLVYLCDDQAQLEDYWAETDKRERAEKLKPDTMPKTHCPALVAEDIQSQAENLLIDIAWPLVSPDGSEDAKSMLYLERREKFLELVTGLVVNQPGYFNPLTGKEVTP
jgi:hypothetical protein